MLPEAGVRMHVQGPVSCLAPGTGRTRSPQPVRAQTGKHSKTFRKHFENTVFEFENISKTLFSKSNTVFSKSKQVFSSVFEFENSVFEFENTVFEFENTRKHLFRFRKHCIRFRKQCFRNVFEFENSVFEMFSKCFRVFSCLGPDWLRASGSTGPRGQAGDRALDMHSDPSLWQHAREPASGPRPIWVRLGGSSTAEAVHRDEAGRPGLCHRLLTVSSAAILHRVWGPHWPQTL